MWSRITQAFARLSNRKIIPSSKLGQFLFFAAENFICFFILVANTRAFTIGSYKWTAITDMLFCLQGAVVGKLMIEDKDGRSWASILGTTFGGMCGSLASIWCTKHLYGA